MNTKEPCTNCGGYDTTWDYSIENKSGVVDGRLRVHDMVVVFHLGCNECSETIKVINGNTFMAGLN